jgi:hypothetical protein
VYNDAKQTGKKSHSNREKVLFYPLKDREKVLYNIYNKYITNNITKGITPVNNFFCESTYGALPPHFVSLPLENKAFQASI